jgi:hypothetical protein
MEAGGHPPPRERLLAGEALADLAQDRHGALGPLRAAAPFVGEVETLDIVGDSGGRGHFFAVVD